MEGLMHICELPPFSIDEDGKAILLFDDNFIRTKDRVYSCDWEIISIAELRKNPIRHLSRYVFYCSNTFPIKSKFSQDLKMGTPYYVQSKKDFDALVESYKQFEYDRKMERLEKRMEEDRKKTSK